MKDRGRRSLTMKLRPLGDRVLVQRVEKEETKGGIVIPDTAKEKPVEGKVIAVGPGARNESGDVVPPDVKVGDRVLFGKYSGMDVKIEEAEYLVLREGDILGTL
jgi:chaperonin GroES